MLKKYVASGLTVVLTLFGLPRIARATTAFHQLAAGGFHSLGLKTDRTVWAWGSNQFGVRGRGQLGHESLASSLMPLQVMDGAHPLPGIMDLAAGLHHSLALRADGAVLAWGANERGQIGDGTLRERFNPAQVKGLEGLEVFSDVVAICAGYHYSLALRADGTVWAWGANNAGQLGDGTTDHSSMPVKVRAVEGVGFLSGVKAIAAGARHSIAVLDTGLVVAWGSNAFGQLGDGTTKKRSYPVHVKGLEGTKRLRNIAGVAAGLGYTVALRDDGAVLAWGANTYGQLGDGSTESRSSPAYVSGLDGSRGRIASIAAGSKHVLALGANGRVRAWGWNGSGGLGDGTFLNRFEPIDVKDAGSEDLLPRAKLIAAGYHHSLALREDGTVRGWGGNERGQLGNNSSVASMLPVQLREMPRGMFDVAHGEGRWTLLTHGGRRNPGRMVSVVGDVADAALRHYIAAPPELSGLERHECLAAISRAEEATLLDFTPVTEGYLTISFDVRVSNPQTRTLDVMLLPEGATGNEAWLLVWGRSPGSVFTLRAGDIADIGDDWQHYAVEANLDDRTYHVWVEGEKVAEDATFRYGTGRTPVGTPYGRLRIGTTQSHTFIPGDAEVKAGAYADIANLRIGTDPQALVNQKP